MRKKYAYFNNKITELKNVKISPYDLGFLRGYGVFDVMRTQSGKLLLPAEHWKSLQNSAREIGLKVPITHANYTKIVAKLLQLNKLNEAVVRTVLTGGLSGNGFAYSPGRETFIILTEKFRPLAREYFEKGAGVMMHEHERQIPAAKTCNYAEAIRQQGKKTKNQALEIVYIKNKKVSEASTSNLFIIKGGKIITTKDGILAGTTRNLVIKLARRAGYQIKEKEISEKELYAADEMFLTATLKTVVPIVKIGGKKIGNGKVGKITRELMEIFAEFLKNY